MKKDDKDGLYTKYEVKKVDTGEEVHGYFVLRLKDKHAREAIKRYAEATDNQVLATQLERWVSEYEDLSCIDPSRGYCKKVESPVCCLHCLRLNECIEDGDIKCHLAELGEVRNREECKEYMEI